MVSTRGPKFRNIFEKGEKVLCFEPDVKKAKVLYDAKILGTYESKDKRGRKQIQYKIHFQGWSSSWDRKVSEDFLLKDTEENRQLQRVLAEKAQLQLGAYLYRREHQSDRNKKRSRKATEDADQIITGVNIDCTTISPNRGSSEENFSSGSTFDRNEDFPMRDIYECDTDSCSSVESLQDEERVQIRISERLREYMEYDYDMITKYKKQHIIPTRIPVILILENFVKQTAMKMISAVLHAQEGTRRRSTQQRTDKKEKEFDKIVSTVALLKEVSDGLRIYFDFTVADFLLYNDEKAYLMSYLSEEYLKQFSYTSLSNSLTLDFVNTKLDVEQSGVQTTADSNVDATYQSSTSTNIETEEPQKRKLRSYRSDDCDIMLENCFSSIASTSSGASTPLHVTSNATLTTNYYKSLPNSTPSQIKDFIQSLLSWKILPTNAAPAQPCMIFGAPHLARLIVKLPEFLNASPINDDKLKVLLTHLETFTNYLEARKELFNEENYVRSNKTFLTVPDSFGKIDSSMEQDQKSNLDGGNSSTILINETLPCVNAITAVDT